jgi:hypothetical protein
MEEEEQNKLKEKIVWELRRQEILNRSKENKEVKK